jgi:mRNA interferase MazF
MAIQRGEIYFVQLGPTKGREIDVKKRPVVVLSIDDINRRPLVVTVIPGGTRAASKPVYDHEIKVDPSASNGLRAPTIFQCFQIKALDHSRFEDRAVGTMAVEDLHAVGEKVKMCLGLL